MNEVNKNLEIGSVLREAFKLLFNNISNLLLIYLLSFAFSLILILPIAWLPILIPAVILLFKKSLLLIVLISVLVVVWAAVGLLIMVWIQGAYFEAAATLIKKEKLQVWQPFKQAFSKLWLYFSTNFLVGIIVLLGLIFLIIPGIWLAIRLFLARMIVAQENSRAITSIRKSLVLTRGHGFLILLIALIIFSLTAVVSWIPFVSFILVGLINLLGTLVQAILYRELKSPTNGTN